MQNQLKTVLLINYFLKLLSRIVLENNFQNENYKIRNS